MKHKLLCSIIAAGVAVGTAFLPASAAVYNNGTKTATFTVTLTLQANCTIAANPLNFGTSGVLSTAINQQSTLSVTCSNTTPYNVGLDAGTVTGSTVTNRLMA